jgi:hypothetical protein
VDFFAALELSVAGVRAFNRKVRRDFAKKIPFLRANVSQPASLGELCETLAPSAVKSSYFFSESFTEPFVFSQLNCKVQAPPDWSKLIVKFSTGADVFETCIGMRASSSDSYL